MQIHQLKYLIAAAEHNSFRSAAQALFVSQSSVSIAIKDLEQELGVAVFERSSRGTTLTPEGAEIVERARSVVDEIQAMESLYAQPRGSVDAPRLAISSQHYSLVVDAFGDFTAAHASGPCVFTLRESYTNEIIRDVQDRRSDLGIIYLSNYNDQVIGRVLAAADLEFTSLYVAHPHAIFRSNHPLARKDLVTMEDLSGYPRFEQEQGLESSSYFAEEPLAATPRDKRIVVSDNGTLSTLLSRTDGYALGTGAFPDEGRRFAAVPIDTDEVMDVGFIRLSDRTDSPYAEEFLRLLSKRAIAFAGPIQASAYARKLGEDGTA